MGNLLLGIDLGKYHSQISVYDEKKGKGYTISLEAFDSNVCQMGKEECFGAASVLHKMITGTFTMPSEECVSSVAGQIFCRGENSSKREGLPT